MADRRKPRVQRTDGRRSQAAAKRSVVETRPGDLPSWAHHEGLAWQERAETSDHGIEGVIPLGPEPVLHDFDDMMNAAPMSDAEWAAQNRRVNAIIAGRDQAPSPRRAGMSGH